MAKVYTMIGMVANDNGDEFIDKLNQRIAELQNPAEGKYIEIQFQANMAQAVALVLQYEEV